MHPRTTDAFPRRSQLRDTNAQAAGLGVRRLGVCESSSGATPYWAGTRWSQDEWCTREDGRDGWVNITEHVVRALRDRPQQLRDGDPRQVPVEPDSEYLGRSVLHADGTVTSTPRPE